MIPFWKDYLWLPLVLINKMDKLRTISVRKRIALVAHDNKKKDLIDWAEFNKTVLARHELYATGTTGKLLEETLDRTVRKLLSGPIGGDQQIGSMYLLLRRGFT